MALLTRGNILLMSPAFVVITEYSCSVKTMKSYIPVNESQPHFSEPVTVKNSSKFSESFDKSHTTDHYGFHNGTCPQNGSSSTSIISSHLGNSGQKSFGGLKCFFSEWFPDELPCLTAMKSIKSPQDKEFITQACSQYNFYVRQSQTNTV